MIKKKNKDKDEQIEKTDESLSEKAIMIEPYQLKPPCQFEIFSNEFDKRKMNGYIWNNVGSYWRDKKEILVLKIYDYC